MTVGPVGAGALGRLSRGLKASLAGVVLSALLVTGASAATVGGIDVGPLARSLDRDPVQVVGSPAHTITAPQVRALRGLIHRRDDGRIWVAVVHSMGQSQTSRLSNGLSGYLNANGGGTVVVVAGSTVWASTSWEDGAGATSRLSAAFADGREPLARQLRAAIISFANGDGAAGHPQIDSGEPRGSASSSSQTAATVPSATAPSGSSGSSSGGAGGLIAGLVAVLIVLGVIAARMVPRMRRARAASHWRHEEHADALAQAKADFARLGEEIEALDIDTSMPNASSQGKDEYAKALDCYQQAERRLPKADDDYQFQHARAAVREGLEHIHTAERLLNQPAPSTPPLSGH